MRTLRARLQGVMSVLIIGALLSCGLAFLIAQAGRQGLQTVYADRVIPLEQLKGISDNYAVLIVDMRIRSAPAQSALTMACAIWTRP